MNLKFDQGLVGMTHFTSLGVIWDSLKARGTRITHLLVLVIDAMGQLRLSWDYQLHNSSSCALGILTTWWLETKDKRPKGGRGRERDRDRDTQAKSVSLFTTWFQKPHSITFFCLSKQVQKPTQF